MTLGENDRTVAATLKPVSEGAPAGFNGRPPQPGMRIAAYQLADYLEQIGVEVIFGLCGHTVIAFLDALGKSRIRFISSRHEQVAAHEIGRASCRERV